MPCIVNESQWERSEREARVRAEHEACRVGYHAINWGIYETLPEETRNIFSNHIKGLDRYRASNAPNGDIEQIEWDLHNAKSVLQQVGEARCRPAFTRRDATFKEYAGDKGIRVESVY